jgi:ATP-dependent RNA helicase DDX46/PRP5
MTPTRELARQVYIEAKNFCKHLGIRVIACYGGQAVQTQIADFKQGAELVVCTPGRMIDMLTLNKGKVTNLRRVTFVVID